MLSEGIKKNNNRGYYVNNYFWRTHQGQEMDYLEEKDGRIDGYEIKLKRKNSRIPKIFTKSYPKSTTKIIDRDNYNEFI